MHKVQYKTQSKKLKVKPLNKVVSMFLTLSQWKNKNKKLHVIHNMKEEWKVECFSLFD